MNISDLQLNRESPPHIGRRFWSFVFGFGALLAAMVAFAVWQGQFRLTPRIIPGETLARYIDDAVERATDASAERLDAAVDAVFLPVYAAVPGYADFHFSVAGDYTELALLIAGRSGELLEDRLFAGFDARAETAQSSLNSTFVTTYEQQLQTQLAAWFGPEGPRFVTPETQLRLETMRANATITQPISRAFSVAGAVVGRRAVRFAGKEIAERVFRTFARRIAAKVALRGGGVGGGAAAGAAVGAILGPPGAAVGAAAGAIGGWLAMDYGLIKLEEAFTRDQFEADLRAMIDAEKAQFRDALQAAIDVKADAIRLAGRTPFEVLRDMDREP